MEITFAHSDSIYSKIYMLFNKYTALVSVVPGVDYFLILQPSPASPERIV